MWSTVTTHHSPGLLPPRHVPLRHVVLNHALTIRFFFTYHSPRHFLTTHSFVHHWHFTSTLVHSLGTHLLTLAHFTPPEPLPLTHVTHSLLLSCDLSDTRLSRFTRALHFTCRATCTHLTTHAFCCHLCSLTHFDLSSTLSTFSFSHSRTFAHSFHSSRSSCHVISSRLSLPPAPLLPSCFVFTSSRSNVALGVSHSTLTMCGHHSDHVTTSTTSLSSLVMLHHVYHFDTLLTLLTHLLRHFVRMSPDSFTILSSTCFP